VTRQFGEGCQWSTPGQTTEGLRATRDAGTGPHWGTL
jgi:hypothetical protein